MSLIVYSRIVCDVETHYQNNLIFRTMILCVPLIGHWFLKDSFLDSEFGPKMHLDFRYCQLIFKIVQNEKRIKITFMK